MVNSMMRKLRKRNNRRAYHKYNLRSKARGAANSIKVVVGQEKNLTCKRPKSSGRNKPWVIKPKCKNCVDKPKCKTTPCAICLDTVGKKKMRKVECGHRFHVSCITSWLKLASTCPVCRFRLRSTYSDYIISMVRRMALSPYLQHLV